MLAADGNYSTPVAQWLYLMGVLAAVGLTFGQLLTQGVDESTQLGRLRRFLAPQVADALLASGSDDVLEPHRRQIAVLFCDLRGFTRFAANHDPEDVVQVLDEYYAAAGRRLAKRPPPWARSRATDSWRTSTTRSPATIRRPRSSRCREIQDDLEHLAAAWDRRGFSLGHGVGVAFGYATLGVIGFEGRSDYTPLGPVVNLASRLSDAAEHGEILVDVRAYEAAGGDSASTNGSSSSQASRNRFMSSCCDRLRRRPELK